MQWLQDLMQEMVSQVLKLTVFSRLYEFLNSDDQSTVRVTNLSEDAQEADIRDLFSHFGHIKRIFLAKDKITQHSKVTCTQLAKLSVCLLGSHVPSIVT